MFRFSTTRKINNNVRYYLLSNSFYYGGFDIINAFLAVLITEHIAKGNVQTLGLILSYSMIVRATLEIFFIKLTKKYKGVDQKNIVVICFLLYGLSTIFLGFSTLIWHVIVFQTIIALLDAIAYPIKWTIFSKILDKNNEELEWSLEDVTSIAVTALFAGIGGFIANHYGIQSIFIVFGLLYIASGISFYFINLKKEIQKK